ncbi:IS30 family transposase [Companilactobacillus huachuanensis]|nr:IS30 family transposase [Companilactobacillus huachuanensis]
MKEVFALVQEQITINRIKGHHLTEIERGKIASLHQLGHSNRKIAKILSVCPQTINNELKRGEIRQVKKINGITKYHDEYIPEAAQARYVDRRKACHRPIKMPQVLEFIAYFVRHFKDDGWSPDAAFGRAKTSGLFEPDEMVCTQTLYKYIDAQLLEVRNIDLISKMSRKLPKRVVRINKHVLGLSIEDRPIEVETRNEFGHFEIDTIVGLRNGQESVILTMIERKTRFQIIRLIDGRDADSVAYTMNQIIDEYGSVIKSITADNGPEFSTLTSVMDSIAPVYFTHPFTSSERGTNEVHNRMVRRDFPKGISLDEATPAEVAQTAKKLNNLPRKIVGYQTPTELFNKQCNEINTICLTPVTENPLESVF